MTSAHQNQVLYAYVADYDLADLEPTLESKLAHFVDERTWQAASPWLVNQRSTELQHPGDLAPWDLGLNVALPEGPLSPAWQSDLAAIFAFLGTLNTQLGIDFAIGLGLPNGVSEDIAYIPGIEFPDFLQSIDPTQ